MTMLQEEVNTADVGQDYAEDIKPAEGQDYAEEPYPKAKGKVEKKQKETKVEGAGDEKGKVEKKGKDKAKSKSKHEKKGSGVNYSKKLNKQYLPTGCGFFGTIGCNRSIMLTCFCLNCLFYACCFSWMEFVPQEKWHSQARISRCEYIYMLQTTTIFFN